MFSVIPCKSVVNKKDKRVDVEDVDVLYQGVRHGIYPGKQIYCH